MIPAWIRGIATTPGFRLKRGAQAVFVSAAAAAFVGCADRAELTYTNQTDPSREEWRVDYEKGQAYSRNGNLIEVHLHHGESSIWPVHHYLGEGVVIEIRLPADGTAGAEIISFRRSISSDKWHGPYRLVAGELSVSESSPARFKATIDATVEEQRGDKSARFKVEGWIDIDRD